MEAYIYDTARTVRGFGGKNGALTGFDPAHLVAQLLKQLWEKHRFDPTLVEDLLLGCVAPPSGQGPNLAKTVAHLSGYGDHLAAATINRFCGSGLEAVHQAAAFVKSGFAGLVVAGGVESMSRLLLASENVASLIGPAVATPGSPVPQFISADLLASKYGYSRSDVDGFAFLSHLKAATAERAGRFASRLPVKDQNGIIVLNFDENINPATTLETLADKTPGFGSMPPNDFDTVAIDRYPALETIAHLHHPHNAAAPADGAAVALIGNKTAGEKNGMKPRAKITMVAVTSSEPILMHTAPADAARLALKKAGMDKNHIDLYEVHESFAVVPLRFMDDLGVPIEKVNVNGGAIALGHPIGATGCILIGTLLDELERQGKQTGIVAIGIGGGIGLATIIERV